MAKKKDNPDPGNEPNKPRKKAGARKPANRGAPLPELPDRRLIEDMISRYLSGDGADDTPQGKARAILDQAYQEPDERRRVALAEKALKEWPDCADAHVLLAEHAPSRKAARERYEQAVAAGQRALGPTTFDELSGHFWGVLETRPYMRARLGLAECLWTLGEQAEAVQHLQELLRLNPNDNQGVRYTLAAWLLLLDRDADLENLLARYPDEESANWAYTHALHAFRRQGDTPEARDLLKRAVKINRHVPAMLLDGGQMPAIPPMYSPGDPAEAAIYAATFLGGWKGSPGALNWLREVTQGAGPKKARVKGPSPKLLQRVKKLNQSDEVWQADFRDLPQWVQVAGQRVRPWVFLVASVTSELVLAHDVVEEMPAPELLLERLVEAMDSPMEGEPLRPAEIQVRAHDHWEAIRPQLEGLGVKLTVHRRLENMDDQFAALTAHVAGEAHPGLLDVPGLTPEKVGSFFAAAADFYKAAPWRKLPYETALRIATTKFESGPWYAVVMGQGGMTVGVALYEDWKVLRKLWTGSLSEEENARATVGLTVLFDDETEVPAADVDAARRHGWKVARANAFPSVFRKERGLTMRPPLAWELELLEGALRAIPGHVAKYKPDDPTPAKVRVPTAGGDLDLELTWMDPEKG